MATRNYCTNVAGELEVLSEKLHHLSDKLDRVPSIDKYKLQTHIDELHIITTELDDRLCEMVTSCETTEVLDGSEHISRSRVSLSPRETRNEFFDYDFGG